jgi:hypothetical protein
MYAVSQNTWRAHHRQNKSREGSSVEKTGKLTTKSQIKQTT